MTILDRIMDWLFDGMVSRYRQQTRAAYWLALATYQRHLDGRPPEPPVFMADAARFIVEDDERVGLRNDQTAEARAFLEQLER